MSWQRPSISSTAPMWRKSTPSMGPALCRCPLLCGPLPARVRGESNSRWILSFKFPQLILRLISPKISAARPDTVYHHAGSQRQHAERYVVPAGCCENIRPAGERNRRRKRIQPHPERAHHILPMLAQITDGDDLADELD